MSEFITIDAPDVEAHYSENGNVLLRIAKFEAANEQIEDGTIGPFRMAVHKPLLMLMLDLLCGFVIFAGIRHNDPESTVVLASDGIIIAYLAVVVAALACRFKKWCYPDFDIDATRPIEEIRRD